MKITWFSNAPWAPTGYGQQTREIVPRIKAAGHEVIVAANYGLAGARMEWEGISIFPAGVESHSTALSPAHHEAWGGDWLITLYDVWPLRRDLFPDNTICWTPVDHQPVPPEVLAWFKPKNGKAPRAIAMSKFGEAELARVGVKSDYIPHSIDTRVFTADGDGARREMDVPADAFVVMVNAANKGLVPARKAWWEMFVACSQFMRDKADAYLYVHTDNNSPIGLKLERLARVAGIPGDRLRWADPYAIASGLIEQTDLAALYRSADVLLATSMGEGFGIPVVEAQACGTPVIVSEFSAQPELVGAGWTVGGQPWWDEAQESILFTPAIGSIIKRLGEAYDARGDNALRERAIAKGAEYDSDKVFAERWLPLLADLERKPAPAPGLNRAERRRLAKSKVKAA